MNGIFAKLNSYRDKSPSKIEKYVANTISVICIPLILCIPIFLIVCADACKEDAALISFITIMCDSILPNIIILLYCWRTGMNPDFPDRKDRMPPILICLACYSLCVALLYVFNAPDVVKALAFGYLFNTIGLGIVSKYWKISVHGTGITGPVIFIAYQFGNIYLLLLLLFFVVSWARYTLGKHTFMQMICGGLMSLLICSCIYLVMLY